MGRIIREEPIFFLLSMYDIVCDFSRNLSHCQFSAIFFFSSSFYSRYHIEIRTYFYIIYMHNCFHNRGGVFNFQIIRDRIVIAWFFFLNSIHFAKFYLALFSFFSLSKCTSIPAIIYFLNQLVRITTVQNNFIICTAVFSWVKKKYEYNQITKNFLPEKNPADSQSTDKCFIF